MRSLFPTCLFLIAFLMTCCTSVEENKTAAVVLIPKPQVQQIQPGTLTLDRNCTLFVHPDFQQEGNFLKDFIENGSNYRLKKGSKTDATIQILKLDSLEAEAYLLDINRENIIINASDAAGAFYGVQTLRQLLPADFEVSNGFHKKLCNLPIISIKDAPEFSYRGMHLDVARHFFPKEFIKKFIANMASLKMNYFHWHLTEDQGWRIEIKKYPKLTTHAAFREETLIGHYNDTPHQFDGERYGGFYTQEDIKEIVAFAAKHHVTIIPEIEMPGHSQAAISAYPELSCTGEQIAVATKWGVFEPIYCPNQKTFTFLENVLTEVMSLFPGTYIHIGGDEAPKKQWKNCSHCQQLIRNLDL